MDSFQAAWACMPRPASVAQEKARLFLLGGGRYKLQVTTLSFVLTFIRSSSRCDICQ